MSTDTSTIDNTPDNGVSRAKEVALEAALRLYEAGLPQFPQASYTQNGGPFSHFVPLVESIYLWLLKDDTNG